MLLLFNFVEDALATAKRVQVHELKLTEVGLFALARLVRRRCSLVQMGQVGLSAEQLLEMAKVELRATAVNQL